MPTPTTVRSTIRFAKKLGVKVILGNTIDPKEFVQFVKSAVANATLRQSAETELQALQATIAARNKRQKPSQRVVQKGGVIYAGNACVAVNKRLEKEQELAAKRAANKASAAARKEAAAQNEDSNSQISPDES